MGQILKADEDSMKMFIDGMRSVVREEVEAAVSKALKEQSTSDVAKSIENGISKVINNTSEDSFI